MAHVPSEIKYVIVEIVLNGISAICDNNTLLVKWHNNTLLVDPVIICI